MFDSNKCSDSWDTQYYIKKLDFILYFLFLFHIKSSVYRDDFVDVGAAKIRRNLRQCNTNLDYCICKYCCTVYSIENCCTPRKIPNQLFMCMRFFNYKKIKNILNISRLFVVQKCNLFFHLFLTITKEIICTQCSGVANISS